MVDAGSDRELVLESEKLTWFAANGLYTNGYSLARKVFQGRKPTEAQLQALLEPHTSYLADLQHVRWKGAAHITGGGIPGNLPRSLPDGLGARLRKDAWDVPAIFQTIRKLGRVSDDEMWATFNMGLGMILVVDPADVGKDALVVGDVVRQVGPDRVVIT